MTSRCLEHCCDYTWAKSTLKAHLIITRHQIKLSKLYAEWIPNKAFRSGKFLVIEVCRTDMLSVTHLHSNRIVWNCLTGCLHIKLGVTGYDSAEIDCMCASLTTASQSGGWVPETSRSFHYWQPAPRWKPLPWLANPGNPAMSPHAEGKPSRHPNLVPKVFSAFKMAARQDPGK